MSLTIEYVAEIRAIVKYKVLGQVGGRKQWRPREQSDQGLHCFPRHPHRLDAGLHCKTVLFLCYSCFNSRNNVCQVIGRNIFFAN